MPLNDPVEKPSGPILIRLGYDIQFELPAPVTMVALLNVHPSRAADLREPDELHTHPVTFVENYTDSFGNRCARFLAPQGTLRLTSSTLISDSGLPDPFDWNAREVPVNKLPHDVIRYLYNSRYCEVDRFSMIALELFGDVPPGWQRVQAVCNWVNTRSIRIPVCAAFEERAGCIYGAVWSVPRFSASGGDAVPRAEYSGALRDRVSRRYWSAGVADADGFQRVV